MNLSQPRYIEPRKGASHIDLNGRWNFGYADAMVGPEAVNFSMTTQVPNSVFHSLFEAGIEPDPYVGTNAKKYAWVDKKVWYYRKTFELPAPLSGRQAILCVDGACYYTRAWVNGVLLGEHEGMFGGPYARVEHLLREDAENEIVLEIRACDQDIDGWSPRNEDFTHKFPIVPWNLARDKGCTPGDFMILGLWGGVRMELLSSTHISRPYIFTEAIGLGGADVVLEAEISDPAVDEMKAMLSDSAYGWTEFTFGFRKGNSGERQDRTLEVGLRVTDRATGDCVYDETQPYAPFDWEKSLTDERYYECHFYRREIRLAGAKLWNPVGLGDPSLYDACMTLRENGRLLDEQAFAFGVRTVSRTLTEGARFRARWDKFQFVVNDRPVFVKGVNWMPLDFLLKLPREEYRWTLERARDAGIQMIRVWSGGGIPETDDFYDLCDEMGIMVWQDHMLANCDSPNWDHDALLNQEAMNLYRLRVHPSLVIHCGGNEFNPYSLGNLASMAVIQHAVEDIDPTREYVRTTPDRGSAHIYEDLEPHWYRTMLRQIPFVAESGIHSFPAMKSLQKQVCRQECARPLDNIFSQEFEQTNPELRAHFAEFIPERVVRMLSRASAVSGLSGIRLERLCQATQMASYEFYQIMIQAARENDPVTAGILPWVFRRPSVAVGVQLMDGLGDPIAPYYAVKNAYLPLIASLDMGNLIFAPGEDAPLKVNLLNNDLLDRPRLTLRLEIFGPDMNRVFFQERTVDARRERRIDEADFGALRLPPDWADKFFFPRVSLWNDGGMIAQSFYWPKCLSLMADAETRTARRAAPMPNLMFEHGPHLMDQVSRAGGAALSLRVLSAGRSEGRLTAVIAVANHGDKPAFPVRLDTPQADTVLAASDNWFCLGAGEERVIALDVLLRPGCPDEISVQASCWNGESESVRL